MFKEKIIIEMKEVFKEIPFGQNRNVLARGDFLVRAICYMV